MFIQTTATSRREFLFQTVASTMALASVRASAAIPSRTIHMAIIGHGGRGWQMLPVFLNQKDVRFIAACDVQRKNRESAKAVIDRFNGDTACVAYRDYRELLARPDLDAVYIALGDRWHARMAIYAMEAGKDVYCEKPISLSMEEGLAVTATAERTGRIYQGGVQRRTVGNFVEAMHLAQSGRLGKIHTVHAGMATMETSRSNHFLAPEPLPPIDEVDWNTWLGPAPWRDYNPKYLHSWHGEYDFHGGLAEWGSHTIDLCQIATGKMYTAPVRYTPVDAHRLDCEYEDGLKLVLRQDGFKNSCAIRLEGDEGWVETDDSGAIYVSNPNLMPKHKVKTESWGRPVAHPAEFIECVRSRKRPSAPPDTLHFSHVASHAATISYRLNRALRFDPKTLRFEDAEANRLAIRPSRAPFYL